MEIAQQPHSVCDQHLVLARHLDRHLLPSVETWKCPAVQIYRIGTTLNVEARCHRGGDTTPYARVQSWVLVPCAYEVSCVASNYATSLLKWVCQGLTLYKL